MRLPGTCSGCQHLVVWNGKAWRNPGQGMRPHRCPAVCGAFMPQAKERCARKPGHKTEHRSRYAMDNERRARGRAA